MSRDPMSDARPGPRAGAFVLLLCTAVVAGRPALAATPIPRIIAVHVLDDVALPLPADARAASHALGFRMGGLSDLVVIAGADGHEELWCVTDRGPNGMVPKPGSDPAAQIGRAHV